MDKEELKLLENRVEELIGACTRLKQENSSLQGLQEEHAKLKEKTQKARERIQSMIERLKTLEHSG